MPAACCAPPSAGVAERLIERNPTVGVDLGSDGEREIVLDGEHYARLFATLEDDGEPAPVSARLWPTQSASLQ